MFHLTWASLWDAWVLGFPLGSPSFPFYRWGPLLGSPFGSSGFLFGFLWGLGSFGFLCLFWCFFGFPFGALRLVSRILPLFHLLLSCLCCFSFGFLFALGSFWVPFGFFFFFGFLFGSPLGSLAFSGSFFGSLLVPFWVPFLGSFLGSSLCCF